MATSITVRLLWRMSSGVDTAESGPAMRRLDSIPEPTAAVDWGYGEIRGSAQAARTGGLYSRVDTWIASTVRQGGVLPASTDFRDLSSVPEQSASWAFWAARLTLPIQGQEGGVVEGPPAGYDTLAPVGPVVGGQVWVARDTDPICRRLCATSAKGRGGPNVCNSFCRDGSVSAARDREIPGASHAKKIIGKPCAGKLHARFERGLLKTGWLL